MHIDLTAEPPADIFCDRAKYRRRAGIMLSIATLGVLLGGYAILSDAPYSKLLEDVALGLLAGPGLVFAYYGEKLQAYKKLNPAQEKELATILRKHPELSPYFALVATSGRLPIMAEFEAGQEKAEELRRE